MLSLRLQYLSDLSFICKLFELWIHTASIYKDTNTDIPLDIWYIYLFTFQTEIIFFTQTSWKASQLIDITKLLKAIYSKAYQHYENFGWKFLIPYYPQNDWNRFIDIKYRHFMCSNILPHFEEKYLQRLELWPIWP